MKYATPTVELIKFNQLDVMFYSDGEKGELPPVPFGTQELSIRDIEDI